jgi:flagellar hook-associated protein 3 FlgL
MTRISTAGQTQLMLEAMLRNQARTQKSSLQVATLKTTNEFRGVAREALTLLGAKETLARNEQFSSSNTIVMQRLEAYDASLNQLGEIAQRLRETVIAALATGSKIGLMEEIEAAYNEATTVLNVEVDDRYLFGGTRTGTPPIAATTPAALLALANTSDAFANNSLKIKARISENQVLEYGLLANDVGQPLFEAFRRIMQFNAGTLPSGATGPAGAFQEPLTDVQKNFLTAELASIDSVSNNLNQQVAKNGTKMQTLDATRDRLADEALFTKKLIREIENVDPAEAVTQLNEDRLALEASMQVLARISRVTLLNFL